MRMFLLLLFLLAFSLPSCKVSNDKEKAKNTISKYSDLSSGKDSVLLEEYKSFYGFIIKNTSQHAFYYVDEKIMTKYISNEVVDTAFVKQDLLQSQWFSPIVGTSYDYFVWLNFIESEPRPQYVTFQMCKFEKEAQIVPVYITQFNRRISDEMVKEDYCRDFFLSGISQKVSLNLVYVIPLNYKMANEYLNIRDTLSREKYKTFIKNILQ